MGSSKLPSRPCLRGITLACLVFGFQAIFAISYWGSASRLTSTTSSTFKQPHVWEVQARHTPLAQLQAESNKTWPNVMRTDNSPRLLANDEFCYVDDGYEHTFERLQHEGSPDKMGLGPCRYYYPKLHPPHDGYTNGVDMFFFRGVAHAKRQDCFLKCMAYVELLHEEIPTYIVNEYLIQATVMGMPRVVKAILKQRKDADPLYSVPLKNEFSHRRGLNAIQEAIRGGYADIVRILSRSNTDLVIDSFGRTIRDYVLMNGSPIRPILAQTVLNITNSIQEQTQRRTNRRRTHLRRAQGSIGEAGWSNRTSFAVDDTCEMDIIEGGQLSSDTFFKEYFLPGRPVLIRNQTPKSEMQQFSKPRWEQTERFHPDVTMKVGPCAYPSNTGQHRCTQGLTIAEMEQKKECPEQPGVPMVHARHPEQTDLDELYPNYDGNLYHQTSGWRIIEEWFGPRDKDFGFQVFFGGDEAGAALHWHNAAVNILYVGMKEWKVSPPLFRGWTGMPAKKSSELLDDSVFMHCLQKPGDLMYIPEYWGHTTVNHGFSIGAAALLSGQYQKFAFDSRRRRRPKYNDEETAKEYRTSNQYRDNFRYDDEQNTNKYGTSNRYRESYQKATYKDDYRFEKAPSTQSRNIPFLFVHINKTGGTSLIDMFRKRCHDEYVSEKWEGGHRSFHATARSFIDHYGQEAWDNAYTFAVVRHPLARQVSNFFFLSSKCTEQKYGSDCHARFLPYSEELDQMTDEEKIEAFHSWIGTMYDEYPPGSPRHYLIGSKGHGNEDSVGFNSTQTSWVVDDTDTIAVKRIYKLERLSEDMSELVEAIPCLRGPSEEGENVEMVHKNESPSYPNFMRFAENERTRQIIHELFASDFENFGYSM